MMGAIVDGQIPCVGGENAGQNGASHSQVDSGERELYLPEDLVDTVLRSCVVKPVSYRGNGMLHKAMREVFGHGPRRNRIEEWQQTTQTSRWLTARPQGQPRKRVRRGKWRQSSWVASEALPPDNSWHVVVHRFAVACAMDIDNVNG